MLALANVRYAPCCHIAFGIWNDPLPCSAFMSMFQRSDGSFLDCYLDSTIGSSLSTWGGIIHADARGAVSAATGGGAGHPSEGALVRFPFAPAR